MAMRTPSPCSAAMIWRVSVKFSIGSRSVTSSTTCESLIGEPAEDIAHVLDDRLVAEQLAGEIERDLQVRPAADGGAGLDADLPHQVARHVVDQPARFHQRNERARQHQRAVGLAPAHQHFGAAQLAGADVDDRLIVRHELAGIERALDLGDRVARARRRGISSDERRENQP